MPSVPDAFTRLMRSGVRISTTASRRMKSKACFTVSQDTSNVGGTDSDGSAALSVRSDLTMCPYCWHRFKPEDVLFIANHPDLMGDPVLGPEELQRFLPSRFTPEGLALDSGGIVCPDMACPRCHLRIPAALLNQPPLFISIVGAPGSGKSYFLASMNWRLRTTVPKLFSLSYMDVDAITNHWLNEYEEKLFLQADDVAWQSIDKTEMLKQVGLYRQVTLNGMNVFLPLPCMFSLQSDETSHFCRTTGKPVGRSVILYDNAGEHFQPGADSSMNPGTHHLVHAEGLFFLFDPTKDPRFRRIARSDDVQLTQKGTVQRQDVLLVEMIARMRKYLGLGAGARVPKSIVLAVSKADVAGRSDRSARRPLGMDASHRCHALDLSRLPKCRFLRGRFLCGTHRDCGGRGILREHNCVPAEQRTRPQSYSQRTGACGAPL